MRLRGILYVTLIMIAAASCEPANRAPVDSASRPPAATADAQWVSELGPLFAVPGDSENTAIVLVPSAPTEPLTAAILRTAGDSVSSARISLGDADTLLCDDAHIVRISGAAPSGWTLALGPTVSALRPDSIERLPPADSATLAADVARLASGVSDSESRFRGLPFAVLAAHRFQIEGRTIVIGRAARRIPQEATPLEERTLVVGEGSHSGQLSLKHSMRSTGAEDIVEHYALLAAVRAGGKYFVVIESERARGTRYEILERSPSGNWQLRWSRQLDC